MSSYPDEAAEYVLQFRVQSSQSATITSPGGTPPPAIAGDEGGAGQVP